MKASKTVNLLKSDMIRNKHESPTHVATQKPNFTMLKKRCPVQVSKPLSAQQCRVVQSDCPIAEIETVTIMSNHNGTDSVENKKINNMYTIENSSFFRNAALNKFKSHNHSVLERPLK